MIKTVKVSVGGLRIPIRLEYKNDRIFIHSGYNKALVDEIKTTFTGYKWHGFDEPPLKLWSIADNEHNAFQLEYLQGLNPYAHYDKEVPKSDYIYHRPLLEHQKREVEIIRTKRHYILAAEMGTGKTLIAIEVMEQSGFQDWWYIGPKNALASVRLEFTKWASLVRPRIMTYEEATKELKTWTGKAPRGLIVDEAARVKTPKAQRTEAIYHVAKSMRKEYGYDSYIILMSGTPAPKSPVDWWSLCNIARPGYLKEGTIEQLKNRLAIIEKTESAAGGFFPKILAWRDTDKRCNKCGKLEQQHDFGLMDHPFEACINEVAKLNRRMKGLVSVVFKKDCVDLPEKVYRIVEIPPDKSTLRAAGLIKNTSKRAIEGLIKLRELSDGFQYKEVETGGEICSNCKGEKQINNEACNFCSGVGKTKTFAREAIRVACPKDDALVEELENVEDVGRIVIYAGFTESIDRVVDICKKQGWLTVRVDGRGCQSDVADSIDESVYKFQNDTSIDKIAFIGHPGSAGEGLTLTKAPCIVYYSNDFNGGYRAQSEDRIHRIGMDVNRGATIIDFIHLPTDRLVLDNLMKKRELQSITLGELQEALTLERLD